MITKIKHKVRSFECRERFGEFFVLEDKGTERPGSGSLLDFDVEGVYLCKRCDSSLYFSSERETASNSLT